MCCNSNLGAPSLSKIEPVSCSFSKTALPLKACTLQSRAAVKAEHLCRAGLMTDRPAVEAWLVCSEPVNLPPQCLSVNFHADRLINSSYYPEFDAASSSTFRYIVNYKTNDTAAQGIITMDVEAKRCACVTPLEYRADDADISQACLCISARFPVKPIIIEGQDGTGRDNSDVSVAETILQHNTCRSER